MLADEIDRKQREEGLAKVEDLKIKKKKSQKNESDIDIQKLAVELAEGVDISVIDGVGLGLILCLTAERGVLKQCFAKRQANLQA